MNEINLLHKQINKILKKKSISQGMALKQQLIEYVECMGKEHHLYEEWTQALYDYKVNVLRWLS